MEFIVLGLEVAQSTRNHIFDILEPYNYTYAAE